MTIRTKEDIENDIRLRSSPCPELIRKINNTMLKGLQTELEYAKALEESKKTIENQKFSISILKESVKQLGGLDIDKDYKTTSENPKGGK